MQCLVAEAVRYFTEAMEKSAETSPVSYLAFELETLT